MISGRSRLNGLNPAVRAAADWALSVADYYGVDVEVTSGYRSYQDQVKLYKNYVECLRTGQMYQRGDCMYPANKPGDSAHQYGLAWDSVVAGQYQAWWNAVREYAGFQVLDNDVIHAQVPDWRQYITW